MRGTAPPVGDPLLQSSAPPALQHGADVDARRLEEALRAAGPALLFGLRLWGSALFLGAPSLIDWLRSRLSRHRGLCAECKGADLDALQKLGLLQWFDARSSHTPFKEDLRAFLKLHGINGRIDYAWVAAVENWRELVGPEVSARVDAIDEIERAVNIGPFTWSPVSRADKVWPKIVGR